MRRELLATTMMVMASAISGCSGAQCPAVQIGSPSMALDGHRASREGVRSIRAEARVDQRGPEGRIRGTVYMFIERPDHVRFDAMTRLGPAAILTSDGAEFRLMDLRENRFFEGATCPSNIARLLGIRLSGAEVTRFLLGDSPRLEAVDEEISCDEGLYVVVLAAADGMKQRLSFAVLGGADATNAEDQELELRSSEVFDAEGESIWLATFDDYRTVREGDVAVSMPFRVQFFDRAHDADTLVRFQSVDLNAPIPEGVFEQEPRPGLAIERVVCD